MCWCEPRFAARAVLPLLASLPRSLAVPPVATGPLPLASAPAATLAFAPLGLQPLARSGSGSAGAPPGARSGPSSSKPAAAGRPGSGQSVLQALRTAVAARGSPGPVEPDAGRLSPLPETAVAPAYARYAAKPAATSARRASASPVRGRCGDSRAPGRQRPPVVLRRQASDAAADGRPARDGGGALRALASAPAGELARLGSQPAPPLARAPSGGGGDTLRQQSAPAAGARAGSGAGGGAEAARLAAVHRSRRKAPAPQRCASAVGAYSCFCELRRQSAHQSVCQEQLPGNAQVSDACCLTRPAQKFIKVVQYCCAFHACMLTSLTYTPLCSGPLQQRLAWHADSIRGTG